jgi:hypothetical protein
VDTTTAHADAHIEPRNDIERAVANIWGELLDLPEVGANDNFLLLGGESLLATQAISRVKSALGHELTVRSVFVSTVAEIAAEIARATGR